MKKIYKLREWLTIEEAAAHLSTVLGEDVTVPDVLRLALDGHLTMSVNLVNKAKARLGRVVPFRDVPLMEMPPVTPNAWLGEVLRISSGLLIDDVEELTEDTQFVCFDEPVATIDGPWDLTMKGAEQLNVEHEFQVLTSGPPIELIHLQGPLVCRSDGQWARLTETPSRPFHTRWLEVCSRQYAAGRGDKRRRCRSLIVRVKAASRRCGAG